MWMPCWGVAASAHHASCAGPASIGASGDRISPARSAQPFAHTVLARAGSAAFATRAPSRLPPRGSACFVRCSASRWGRSRLIQLYPTVLEYLAPAVQLFAHEAGEFLGRAAGGGDAG